MKRIALMLLFAAVLLLSGCARGQQEAPGPELILRYADNQPEDYPTTKAAEYFAQLVEERTQGKICVRVYSNGELGSETSVLEQVQFGGIDLARVSMGTLVEVCQEVEVLMLPFLYNDADHMWRVLDGSIGEKFLIGTRKAGVIGLSWFDAGARSFYTRSRITCLEDMQDMTIRVQESNFMSRMVELLGAVPVQIPYGDVYSALQTAKIDGAENNWPSYESTGHFQAAPYYLLDEHSRIPEMQIMSTVALDKIAEVDKDYVQIVRECAKECALYERELWKAGEADSERLVREYGCVVTELTEAQMEEFWQAVQPLYEELSQEDQALIQEIRNS